MLAAERADANILLDERETQLRGIEDFAKLDAQGQQVLAKLIEARSAIASARFVAAIRIVSRDTTTRNTRPSLPWSPSSPLLLRYLPDLEKGRKLRKLRSPDMSQCVG
jgi:hypothetical protein